MVEIGRPIGSGAGLGLKVVSATYSAAFRAADKKQTIF